MQLRKFLPFLMLPLALSLNSCAGKAVEAETAGEAETVASTMTKHPSDVLPFMDEWKILLGDGTNVKDLVGYAKEDFFYVQEEEGMDWVVYKTPNSGITSRTSSNTRTELGQKDHWVPETGGKLTGTLKVMHVSTNGDARVAASYSVVVGQIHSGEGHENEPLKIFYKKFPGHDKGSLFWNYEINTEGDNKERWDFSTAIWGYDMSVVGTAPDAYPEEPADGIALGEEFSYEVNVYEGIMYLTFNREGQEPKTFTKNLIASEYVNASDIPQQVLTVFASTGQDGTEQPGAYTGELNYFKQGAYNQTNGKSPESNMVWGTGAEVYGGDIAQQYANGSYTEVWFREATVGAGTPPKGE
ncbi:polysaccharide lyase family 7 protein [Neolewinella agarilytica]|uniref:Alginate lyase n=1 Tax=Neolewinella agarilytica TaxID=478744 RepID=A0A1H9PIZ5_9BACT|nr:polysaccharide lyase family 7 protein [Neolewinella agarilytica]SER47533.1 Alginate lyase [Neolewinella agarilytica]